LLAKGKKVERLRQWTSTPNNKQGKRATLVPYNSSTTD